MNNFIKEKLKPIFDYTKKDFPTLKKDDLRNGDIILSYACNDKVGLALIVGVYAHDRLLTGPNYPQDTWQLLDEVEEDYPLFGHVNEWRNPDEREEEFENIFGLLNSYYRAETIYYIDDLVGWDTIFSYKGSYIVMSPLSDAKLHNLQDRHNDLGKKLEDKIFDTSDSTISRIRPNLLGDQGWSFEKPVYITGISSSLEHRLFEKQNE